MATGYGQFCPIAKAAEVICDRWTPLVLRDVDDKFLPWGLRRTVVGRRRLVLRLDFHGWGLRLRRSALLRLKRSLQESGCAPGARRCRSCAPGCGAGTQSGRAFVLQAVA